MKNISIIIPVYNVESYLEECLSSVCEQGLCDIEILCIDDNSTDNSLVILEEYAKKDGRIRVFHNSLNKGLSYTRNYGLKYAQGNYIYFLDSDDKLKPYALKTLYEIAEREQTDCIFFSAESFCEKNFKYQHDAKIAYKERYPGVWNGKELFIKIVDNNEWVSPVQLQFINFEFLKRNSLKCYEGILHEDVLFTFQTMLLAKRAMCLNDVYYEYRHRENSIMSSPVTKERIKGVIIAYLEMQKFCDKFVWNTEVLKRINRRLFQIAASIKSMIKTESEFNLYEICKQRTVMEYQLLNLIIDGERFLGSITEINESQLDKIKRFNHIILFGAGKIGREVLRILDSNNIGILGYAVSDIKNHSGFVMGHPVMEIGEWRQYKKSALVIITVSNRIANEVRNILLDEGFENILILPDNNTRMD